MRDNYQIDALLTDEEAEALAEIIRIRSEPPPEAEPTAEERIAAALEFQSMMLL